ncbi:MAG TPA: hypothetical protein VJH69_02345 [Candidatus Paceibacterota bacterium]
MSANKSPVSHRRAKRQEKKSGRTDSVARKQDKATDGTRAGTEAVIGWPGYMNGLAGMHLGDLQPVDGYESVAISMSL